MTSGYILRCCDNILLLHQSHNYRCWGLCCALTHTHSQNSNSSNIKSSMLPKLQSYTENRILWLSSTVSGMTTLFGCVNASYETSMFTPHTYTPSSIAQYCSDDFIGYFGQCYSDETYTSLGHTIICNMFIGVPLS